MSEFRKLKHRINTKRWDHPIQNGQHPLDEGEEEEEEEQPRYNWPRAPPVSPSAESPRTPGGSQKKAAALLGKVIKSKAKKLMHLLHHHKKTKPAQEEEELMWTPRAGPGGAEDVVVGGRALLELDAYFGTSKVPQHPTSFTVVGGYERTTTTEVFTDASPRQSSPALSPTSARMDHPYFKKQVSRSRFESEMKEANEILRESKRLRVNMTTKQIKTVTFAPTVKQHELIRTEKSGSNSRELWDEAAHRVLHNAYETLYQVAIKMVRKIQVLVAYNVDRRHVLEKVVSVSRYLLLKLEPGQDDIVLSEVVTEAFLDLYDIWNENVERPLVRRAKEISSSLVYKCWKKSGNTPVPVSTALFGTAGTCCKNICSEKLVENTFCF